ncbi:hypothetical protein MDUV_18960 [Mycolicibacterium duvalii]|uniref:Uncharacterized protein n=1 Tax=Mycolicibacterium duvalii TaxID=39688 RepID=A0A7I7JYS0_9MYCO|nr:hypothetical protein MDUV_18960 [Mycolicibacterium duvalii]
MFTGVVDQDVDATEPLVDQLRGLLNGSLVTDIARHCESFTGATVVDLGGDPPGTIRIDVGDDHTVGTFVDEPVRERFAESLRCTRDTYGLARETAFGAQVMAPSIFSSIRS